MTMCPRSKTIEPKRRVPSRALPAEASRELCAIAPRRKRRRALNTSLALAACMVFPALAHAQGNYEVQVYGSDLIPPGQTMVELHSNFTFQGSKTTVDGVRPDIHALHETLEVTQGFTPWLETGFYLFTSYRPGEGLQYVGNHIRPRVRIPEDWNWPVGLSLSTEVGYQRRSYSPDTWTWEIRPIVDKDLGPWYLCFNPTLERSFHGAEVGKGVTFSPNVKIGYAASKKVSAGIEILRRGRLHHGLRPAARSAASHRPGRRPEPESEMGIQLRSRRRHDERHRPPVGEDDPGPPVAVWPKTISARQEITARVWAGFTRAW